EVVGKLFDNEVGHGKSHLLGECHFIPKPLIYNDNKDYFDYEITDSGTSQRPKAQTWQIQFVRVTR
ncbi:MAG TPA: hypothetical protein VIM63_10900, partial [Rhodoferax sp.]